tara:strand:+ start:1134 stop:1973 length:840 start_codon:yes stop_codon:yes gene_type:complete
LESDLYTYIDSIEDLAYLNEELLNKSYVGVDTEFRRTTKDNMRLALLQINDEDEIYLIDTLLIDDPKDKCSFLYSDSVTKILHSCKEDLEAIYSWTNKKMCNVFDTQIANAFLNGDYSVSYRLLVEKKLGIILEKNETRSNWLRRPLTDSQLKYASLDVEYLINLFLDQREELETSKKLNWHDEDISQLIKVTFERHDNSRELVRSLPKAREEEMLYMFNNAVQKIAAREHINPTLFFSKKSQKDFLRLTLIRGIDLSLSEITDWRGKLIKDDILNILK